MTNYGMSLFLEDKTGLLTGSEFIDLHDRMRLVYRCTARDSSHTAYMIYDATTYAGSSRPLVVLDFGPNNQLGTISVGPNNHIEMKKYLTKVSLLDSKVRKFVASDGQEYRWSYRLKHDQEWTCTNNRGYLIAYYSLRTPGEPPYANSSGCMLTVEQEYGPLAAEMLASVMIMRHIVAHNL